MPSLLQLIKIRLSASSTYYFEKAKENVYIRPLRNHSLFQALLIIGTMICRKVWGAGGGRGGGGDGTWGMSKHHYTV